MAPGETGLLTRNPWVARRVLTVAEYHRMGEVGILTKRDHVELIEGELIAMSPIGSEHAGTVNALNRLLVQAVGDRGVVAVQNPVRLDDLSEPQPDFAVLKPRADDYRRAPPRSVCAFENRLKHYGERARFQQPIEEAALPHDSRPSRPNTI